MKAPSFVAAVIVLAIVCSFIPSVNAQNEETAGARKVLAQVTPTYPAFARNLNLTGTVNLEVVVAANGSVKSVRILGGNPVLVQSAESAVHAWKWEKSDRETTERLQFHFTP